jgi:hypothetical protein
MLSIVGGRRRDNRAPNCLEFKAWMDYVLSDVTSRTGSRVAGPGKGIEACSTRATANRGCSRRGVTFQKLLGVLAGRRRKTGRMSRDTTLVGETCSAQRLRLFTLWRPEKLTIPDVWQMPGVQASCSRHSGRAQCVLLYAKGRRRKDHTGQRGDAADFCAHARGPSPEEGAKQR